MTPGDDASYWATDPDDPTYGPVEVRKKPVVVDSFRYDGTPTCAYAIVTWAGPAARYVLGELIITTFEGDHAAQPGDYVMRGTRGEFYPIKPQVYADVYEPAGEGQ